MSASELLDRWRERMPAPLERLVGMRPRYPLVGVELRPDAVIAARVGRRKGAWHLEGTGRAALPDGTIETGPVGGELRDGEALVAAVREALAAAGAEGTTRISLAVPDALARMFVVDVRDLPAAHAQADEMIRFRIRKSIPFPLSEARLAWHNLGRFEDGHIHVLVAVAPEQGVGQIERTLEAAGLRTGLVDLASIELINALRLAGQLEAAGGGDLALINATTGSFSVAILRGERLIFFRSKAYHVQGGFRGDESLRVVGRELRTTMSYYEEHLLGEGLSEVLVRACGVPAEPLIELALEAGGREAAVPDASGLLPELGAFETDEIGELLPALGLALRRLA
ncbi:MAG: hypothetical protein Kow0062_28630 [Acidobacteriota bacterium]